uniref:Uncharacterized protein n=1 Tax=Rhizophora mucronata TaxID=61149 RepID=A0A2P2NBB5_RHIMU
MPIFKCRITTQACTCKRVSQCTRLSCRGV